MSLGLTVLPVRRSMSRSFVGAIHATAFTCLAGAVLVALAFQVARPEAAAWPAMLAVLPTAIVLYLLDRWRTTIHSITYLLVGGASVYAYSLVMATQIDLTEVPTSISVAMPKIALILVGGSGVGALSGLRWCTAGFVVAEIASSVAIRHSGSPYVFDNITTAAYATIVLSLVLTYVGQRRTRPTQTRLRSAARDDLASTLRYRIELNTAALLHDTVLSHLAAITASANDTLDPGFTTQVKNDLARLTGGNWVTDTPLPPKPDGVTWRSSPLYRAIQEARELGLEVDTTGDFTALPDLECDRATALGLAVKQCLVNVLRHAGTKDAEVAVYGAADEVLVMVIDTGCGFIEEGTASDRLGLRTSVRHRIEEVGGTVQIWSTPGRGTSVVLQVPIGSGGVKGAENATGAADEEVAS